MNQNKKEKITTGDETNMTRYIENPLTRSLVSQHIDMIRKLASLRPSPKPDWMEEFDDLTHKEPFERHSHYLAVKSFISSTLKQFSKEMQKSMRKTNYSPEQIRSVQEEVIKKWIKN